MKSEHGHVWDAASGEWLDPPLLFAYWAVDAQDETYAETETLENVVIELVDMEESSTYPEDMTLWRVKDLTTKVVTSGDEFLRDHRHLAV